MFQNTFTLTSSYPTDLALDHGKEDVEECENLGEIQHNMVGITISKQPTSKRKKIEKHIKLL